MNILSLCCNIILECPHGWIDAKHVNLGCLYFEKDNVYSWFVAKTFCENLNSHLVEIFDSTQQTFLKQKLLEFDKSFVWWIGLTDSPNYSVEGTWIWLSSGNISTYYSWGINEPNGGVNKEINICIS